MPKVSERMMVKEIEGGRTKTKKKPKENEEERWEIKKAHRIQCQLLYARFIVHVSRRRIL